MCSFGNTLFMRIGSKPQSVVRRIFIVMDSVIFSFLLFLPVFVSLSRSGKSLLFGFLYCGILGAVILIRMKMTSRTEQYRKQESLIRRKTDMLFLKSDESLSMLTQKKNFILIRKEHPDRFDVLEAIRKGADAIGIIGRKNTFSELIRSYSPELTVYCIDDLIRIIDESENREAGEEVGRFHKHAIVHLNQYLLLGILFFVVSFIFKFKIYFRVLSGICLFLAYISYFLRKRETGKNFLIFLDNRGDR